MSDITSPRRYYLGMRLLAHEMEEHTLEGVWRWKQESQPGTPLPEGFPYADYLAPFGYTTVEDLYGANEEELTLGPMRMPGAGARIVLETLDLVRADLAAELLASVLP